MQSENEKTIIHKVAELRELIGECRLYAGRITENINQTDKTLTSLRDNYVKNALSDNAKLRQSMADLFDSDNFVSVPKSVWLKLPEQLRDTIESEIEAQRRLTTNSAT